MEKVLNFKRKYKEGFTTAEVAEILNFSRAYIWALIRQGRIKYKMLGRDFVIPEEEMIYLTKNGVRTIEESLKK